VLCPEFSRIPELDGFSCKNLVLADTLTTVESRENLALAALVNVLPEDLQPRVDGPNVRIEYAGTETTLAPVWVAEGFPADVRRGLDQIREIEPGAVPVIAGRRISTGSQEILNESGVSWVDAGGYANVHAGGIFVARLLRAPRSTERGMPWSRAAATVGEVILERRGSRDNRDRVERAAQVADLTEISYARTSRILSVFDDNGYTAKVGPERGPTAAREFRDPGGLLSDWASHHARTLPMGPTFEFHVPWRGADQSLRAVNDALGDVDWILSGAAAAQMLSPFLTEVADVTIYVNHDRIEHARRSLVTAGQATEVERGGRLQLRPGEPHLLPLARDAGPYRTAPAVRVYGDLLRLGGRAAEAAEHLRETVIGF
jgi:hypothetical protein